MLTDSLPHVPTYRRLSQYIKKVIYSSPAKKKVGKEGQTSKRFFFFFFFFYLHVCGSTHSDRCYILPGKKNRYAQAKKCETLFLSCSFPQQPYTDRFSPFPIVKPIPCFHFLFSISTRQEKVKSLVHEIKM